MPRQVSARELIKSQDAVGTTTGARSTQTNCPGCKRKSGANSNVQLLKQTRMKFASAGLLAEAPDNSTANDDALGILSSMGIGFVTAAAKAPNPRSENQLVSNFVSDFSLLSLETDNTNIPNAKLFDKTSFNKKTTDPIFVKITDLYKSPVDADIDETSNIFKPDDNPTDIEKRHKLKVKKINTPNVVQLVQALQQQQQQIGKGRTRLMIPHYKIVYGKQGG